MNLDMTRPDRDLTPGVDLWQVHDAKEATSKKGSSMIETEFARVSDPSEKIKDYILVSGDGWSMGKRKLTALGVPPTHTGTFNPSSLIERRVWLATTVTEYQGKSKLQVDINELKFAGYQPENDPPAGKTAPAPVAEADRPW